MTSAAEIRIDPGEWDALEEEEGGESGPQSAAESRRAVLVREGIEDALRRMAAYRAEAAQLPAKTAAVLLPEETGDEEKAEEEAHPFFHAS